MPLSRTPAAALSSNIQTNNEPLNKEFKTSVNEHLSTVMNAINFYKEDFLKNSEIFNSLLLIEQNILQNRHFNYDIYSKKFKFASSNTAMNALDNFVQLIQNQKKKFRDKEYINFFDQILTGFYETNKPNRQ